MRVRRTVAGVALSTLSATLLATIPSTAAQAASPDLVISQVYGGGGNSGAQYSHDFIEIQNRGTVPVSLAGMSLQYASAAGTFGTAANLVTPLPDVAVPPGGYFLVQEAAGEGTPGALPTPDATDGTPIAMSASNGKVALATGTAALNCSTAATCAGVAGRIVDLVGYGTASHYETRAVAALSNSTAAIRKAGADTDVNADDFEVAAPTPRNSGTVEGPEEPDEPAELYDISEVQGPGVTSPLVGTEVAIEGVVVGDFQERGQYSGYFVQSLEPDDDPLTSEGIRVFDFATPVAVGEHVRVTGTVSEFSSADSDGTPSGSETQLGAGSTVERLGRAELPEPVVLHLPFEGGTTGPERYEGMRVTLPAGLVATDLYTLGRYGEVGLTSDELLRIPTTLAENAANDADQILLDDGLSGQNLPTLPYTIDEGGTTLPRAGDVLAEPVTGVMSFNFGFYRVEPPVGTTAGFTSVNPRTPAPDAVGGDVQVASFNVLNYFVNFGGDNRGADNAAELIRQEAKLVSAITALDADVVGLIEIANDRGEALSRLVAALNAAQPDPADDYTAVVAPALTRANGLGGTYGTDAIRTAIVYRPSVVTPAGPPPSDPALLNPADPAFPGEPLFDRPPAVQVFTPVGGGEEFTVLVNHLKSKGSTNAQCGRPDPLGGNCDDLRERQAAGLVDLVEQLGTEDALLLGDFNSYEAEAPIDVLEAAGFVNTAAELSTADRYSYSFDGEFGTLDYIFASSGLAESVTGVDIWHINSAESPAYDYNEFNQPQLYSPGPYASSDHDPVLIGLELVNEAPVADAGADQTVRVDRDVTLDASGSSDPDGNPLTYAWDLDGDGAFDDATGATVAFGAGLPPGYYTVAVQVSDGAESDVDEAVVTITTPNGKMPPGRR